MSQPAVISQTHLSKVWLVPLLVLIAGASVLYYQWRNQGPLITIALPSAAGIEVNLTPIKMRDLDIGQVKKIELKPDLNGVIVTARIDASAARLLTESAEFWVVTPRISFSEVSGLNTLFSGSYIAMSASGIGRAQFDFIGLARPPITPAGTPGLAITLTSDAGLAYKPGDPVIYKGLVVGQFEEAQFDIEQRAIRYRVFINAPYHELVTRNTRFWDASGVKLKVTANGLSIETGSVETLLANGVSFDIPDGASPAEKVTENAQFHVFPDMESANDARFLVSAKYLMMIDESVRGLSVGAPVEYRGLQVGKVEHINADILDDGTMLEAGYPIPVVISIYPGKVKLPDNDIGLAQVKNTFQQWLQRDLRATLRMGNIVTGGLYVDLQHSETEENGEVQVVAGYQVIPTSSTEFTQLTQKADALLEKLNSIPVEQLSAELLAAVRLMGDAADAVRSSSGEFDKLAANIDTAAINRQVNQALNDLNQIISGYKNEGVEPKQLKDTITTLETTLRNMQPILRQLNSRPNSLLFSDNLGTDIEPKAAPTLSQE